MNKLIHKNYRKLVDVEEWVQIVIVNMLGMPGHSLLILTLDRQSLQIYLYLFIFQSSYYNM